MIELLQRMRDDEARRRSEDETRRRERDDENRIQRVREEAALRDKRELQVEKLKVLGSYKDGVELLGYLNKFERIMSECEIGRAYWAERLFPRLPE